LEGDVTLKFLATVLHLPCSTPNQPIFAYALTRLSRMVI
jgi:hypothetical protein